MSDADDINDQILVNAAQPRRLKDGEQEIENPPLTDLIAASDHFSKTNSEARTNPFNCLRTVGLNFPGAGA